MVFSTCRNVMECPSYPSSFSRHTANSRRDAEEVRCGAGVTEAGSRGAGGGAVTAAGGASVASAPAGDSRDVASSSIICAIFWSRSADSSACRSTSCVSLSRSLLTLALSHNYAQLLLARYGNETTNCHLYDRAMLCSEAFAVFSIHGFVNAVFATEVYSRLTHMCERAREAGAGAPA